ncbi:unnamed protein product [Discula destructiva]
MLRQIKPRNARSKRALDKRAPKPVENPKTVLFLRGTSCSQISQDALADLFALRQPLAKKFTKKNAIHPFEDASSLEFFADKNDASFLVFGSSSKKRPHCLTFVRTFGFKLLDMLELYIEPATFRMLKQFKGKKPAVGLRPMVVFAGTAWESTVQNEYTTAKSMLTDFFCGERTADKIDVEGLQYVVVLTADDGAADGAAQPAVHLRAYLIKTKKSGQKLPRVEVEEMGPRIDFRLGRMQEPEDGMLKEALKRAQGTEEKTKKNISMDIMGDKIGRIHTGKLDLSDLQTRKMKGLKRSRDADFAVDADDDQNNDQDSAGDDAPSKRRK